MFDRVMKTIILTLIVVSLMIGAHSAMANHGYWTSSSSYVPFGLEKYHIYLYGSYPSSTGEATRIVNEHLSVCLDFSSDQKPYICHRISPNLIPQANDSMIDAGFFVAPSSLNMSNANICVHVGYRNLYSCSHNSGVDPDSLSRSNIF